MMAGIVARPAWKGRWIDFAICGCSGFQYDVSLNTLRRRTGARQKAFYEPGALIEGNESDASTATGLTANSPNDLDKPDDLTLDLFSQMVESGLIPQNR